VKRVLPYDVTFAFVEQRRAATADIQTESQSIRKFSRFGRQGLVIQTSRNPIQTPVEHAPYGTLQAWSSEARAALLYWASGRVRIRYNGSTLSVVLR
jgi:hypothetical protein